MTEEWEELTNLGWFEENEAGSDSGENEGWLGEPEEEAEDDPVAEVSGEGEATSEEFDAKTAIENLRSEFSQAVSRISEDVSGAGKQLEKVLSHEEKRTRKRERRSFYKKRRSDFQARKDSRSEAKQEEGAGKHQRYLERIPFIRRA